MYAQEMQLLVSPAVFFLLESSSIFLNIFYARGGTLYEFLTTTLFSFVILYDISTSLPVGEDLKVRTVEKWHYF